MEGKSVLTEVILCPSFLGVVWGWMWLITGVQLTSYNSLSFSDLVAFVRVSLPCVSAWGSRLELPRLTDQSLLQSWLFPASLEKKKKSSQTANHLSPTLIASWLHSLFWLKVQLLHGWFLPRNCRTIVCFCIFCVRGVTNQEETSDTVKCCVRQKLVGCCVPVISRECNQLGCGMGTCILWEYCLCIIM